jgi:hypothetical protein
VLAFARTLQGFSVKYNQTSCAATFNVAALEVAISTSLFFIAEIENRFQNRPNYNPKCFIMSTAFPLESLKIS